MNFTPQASISLFIIFIIGVDGKILMIQTSVSGSECADIVTFTGFWPKFDLETKVKFNYLHVLTIHE
jgi:hypothetical protein